ncbi:MAG: hypothetical protein QNJ00_12935, partial [Woeseiaceae bacterium]|nr:hypothetical protein [Woeseiaceae bacterium]
MQRIAALIALVVTVIVIAAWIARDRGAEPVEAIESVVDAPVDPAPRTKSPGIDFPALSRETGPLAERLPEGQQSKRECTDRELVAAFEERLDSDKSRARHAALASTLTESGNTELVLAGAMLSGAESPFDAIERTQLAMQLGPQHPLVLWQAAELCSREQQGEFCGDPTLRLNSEQILGRNGAYWSKIAAGRIQRGEKEAALAALKRAAVEPQWDDYWIERVMLLERALAVGSDVSYALRITEAMTVTAGDDGLELSLMTRACRRFIAEGEEWLGACTGFGNRLVASRGLLHQVQGYELLRNIYKRQGDDYKLAEVSADLDELKIALEEIEEADFTGLMTDDRIAALFIDEHAANGELAAIRQMAEETRRIKSDPDYDS